MDNKFQLWSPPLLDLSLDSFSNDLMQEFDKTRTGQAHLKKMDNTTLEQLESLEVNNTSNHRNNSILSSSSPIDSSVTLPPSERETSFHEQQQQEEDFSSSSTANLFRKSSTFLKKKLSQSGASKKDENSSISTTTTTNTTTNAEDNISNIISRQYPPKPLQYSPVVEPPSDILQTINSDNESSFAASSIHTNTLPRSSRDIAPALKSNAGTTHQNRMSHPISITSTATSVSANTPVPAPTTAATTATNTQSSAPKRRSFFSLRFC
ncbi:hypothetical protein MFLAVUS_005465 [Mucor flavus]|uniref:Uncharacterized protein n=1 Tax=Mucor flavus TaxID=439312 RepID=A0ABP9YYV5_9FUNG